jgi:NAD(P)-dependent dehydrogenase (short-subunit alcohol dehydrogenase family)
MSERTSLRGRVALVTGGNGGIGAAACRALSARGAAVAVNYVAGGDAAEALAVELSERADAFAVRGDVSSEADVKRMVFAVGERLGPVDVLVNNAGIGFDALLVETEEADWERVMAINLKGQFLCAREVVRGLRERGAPGALINIASEVALIGCEKLTAYSAAKGGTIAMTKTWARELTRYGIRVNCVAPGPVDTELLSDHDRSEEFVGTIPLNRLGRPEEIGAAIAFLASEEASFVIGQVLSPNGGVVI